MGKMKKIAITGGNGMIGTILRNGLIGYKITSLDLPECDVRDYRALVSKLRGNSIIIHLAWNTQVDNANSDNIDTDNSLMFLNVYRATLEIGAKRVIIASSVHADAFYKNYKDKVKMSPNQIPFPDSPYGAHKVFMESLGRYYSKKGLEVICIRFGGGLLNDNPPESDHPERAVWLSKNDCVNLVRYCIEAKSVPDNFAIIYGVSDNKGRIHDVSNTFGWRPMDN